MGVGDGNHADRLFVSGGTDGPAEEEDDEVVKLDGDEGEWGAQKVVEQRRRVPYDAAPKAKSGEQAHCRLRFRDETVGSVIRCTSTPTSIMWRSVRLNEPMQKAGLMFTSKQQLMAALELLVGPPHLAMAMTCSIAV